MSLLEELNERYKTIADEAEKLDAHRRTLMLGMNELLPAIWALEAEQKKNASGFDDGEAMRKAQADASKTARTVTAEQAPAQADPPSELRTVTPATEESAGGGIPEGFIEWNGGDPPGEHMLIVDLIFRSGATAEGEHIGNFDWSRYASDRADDIIAYRIVTPSPFTDRTDPAQTAIEAFMQRPGAELATSCAQLSMDDIVDVFTSEGNVLERRPAGSLMWSRLSAPYIVAYAPAAIQTEAAE